METWSRSLRTTVAIAGYAALLEMGVHGPINDAQRDDLTRMQASQRHLLTLINEVLIYAKLESGSLDYDLVDIDVGAAVGEAAEMVVPQYRDKSLRLEVLCTHDLRVRADPDRFCQIVVNLLSNALKFSASGGAVTVECGAEEGLVSVRISDTGIGIPADQLEAIFQPFVQVRSELTRTHEGTGLGLAISRDLARGMGGDVTVESEPGRGSRFELTLPLP